MEWGRGGVGILNMAQNASNDGNTMKQFNIQKEGRFDLYIRPGIACYSRYRLSQLGPTRIPRETFYREMYGKNFYKLNTLPSKSNELHILIPHGIF